MLLFEGFPSKLLYSCLCSCRCPSRVISLGDMYNLLAPVELSSVGLDHLARHLILRFGKERTNGGTAQPILRSEEMGDQGAGSQRRMDAGLTPRRK